jgi:folate-dependent phosphoribosylglycinamide formyltransferase PurN
LLKADPEAMRIVVLTSETPGNVWLVNHLLARHEVAAIVVERRPLALSARDKAERRRRMVRRYGLVRTLNKLLFNRVRSRLLSRAAASTLRDSFFPGRAPIAYARAVPTLVVGDINDAAVVERIRAEAPDVLAVCGTSVLKPEVFTLAPKGAINIHTGITPEYRSADPIFWALYRGEPEKVGVTIHYIDRGIDTGSIIHQEPVPVFADDTLDTVYVRCIRRGAALYTRALAEIENGSVRTVVRTGAESRAFLSVDLGLAQYLMFRWRFKRLAFRLPRRAVDESAVLEAQP